MKNKFYAIMEGTRKATRLATNKETGALEEQEHKIPVSQLFVAEGRTRIEALNEVEENARKTGRKISYFGKFG